ncbi:MAG: ATP-binding protein [Patescibacteria group bacterium]|nr:hypothetical protein [Patescibacteria group bacterium]
MDLAGFLVLLSLIVSFLLGLVVHFKAQGVSYRVFEVTVFGVVGWCLAMFLYRLVGPGPDLFWARALYFFPSFIPSAFVLFGLSFPDQPVNKWLITLIVSINLIVAFFCLVPGAVIVNVITPSIGEKIIVFGWAYTLYLIYLPSFFTISYFVLLKKYFTGSPRIKQQVLYVLLGLSVSSLIAIVSNLILPTLGVFEFNWLGQVSAFFWMGCVTYAIVKHRLMDIRLVIARAISHFLLIAVLVTIYTFGIFLISSLILPLNMNFNQLTVSVILTILVALSFQALRRWLEKVTDKIFFKGHYVSEKLLTDLGQIIASTLVLKTLTQKFFLELTQQMKLSWGALFLVKGQKVVWLNSKRQKTPEVSLSEVKELVETGKKLLILEELPENKIKEIMRKLNIGAYITLGADKKNLGILALGGKSSGDVYSKQDIEVIEILAPQLTVAIENAQAYEKIQRFSDTLRKEVDRATRKLQRANIRLKELSTLKDEFVSIASHQLRTPMTAIKSYLWLVMRKKGKALDSRNRRNLDRAYTSVERMIVLVKDMLTVSRIEGKRLDLDMVEIDLHELAKKVYQELKIKADEKDVRLVLESPKIKTVVKADQERIREVIQNLTDNAIKFTPKGGRARIFFRKTDNRIETSISDTGAGISKRDMPKLFQKFSRLEHSFSKIAETPGTGLGLYIAKQIVGLHKGSIRVKSKVGKGSIFTFSLPRGWARKNETKR